ncbi:MULTISPECIES: hypothetical protein [Halomonas]|uniref:Uncharacterized protein n=1 Tax=Halomonas flagellata TaxID=2920385 RepID=A0ABS9RWU4_9GAMM|nr:MULTISPECIES: hypothetical protein [Halomonas]MCH4564328.1 hypothetical protein [Halomonas flagellata]
MLANGEDSIPLLTTKHLDGQAIEIQDYDSRSQSIARQLSAAETGHATVTAP